MTAVEKFELNSLKCTLNSHCECKISTPFYGEIVEKLYNEITVASFKIVEYQIKFILLSIKLHLLCHHRMRKNSTYI